MGHSSWTQSHHLRLTLPRSHWCRHSLPTFYLKHGLAVTLSGPPLSCESQHACVAPFVADSRALLGLLMGWEIRTTPQEVAIHPPLMMAPAITTPSPMQMTISSPSTRPITTTNQHKVWDRARAFNTTVLATVRFTLSTQKNCR